MKKLLILLGILSATTNIYANLNGSGYYRVRNAQTLRWASLVDNKGNVDLVSGSADLHALQLNSDTEEILSDPGSVVYFKNVSGYQYDVAAQGTSLENLVDNPIKIRERTTNNDGENKYLIWGTYKGATKYIYDSRDYTDSQYGYATIGGDPNNNNNLWYIYPMDENSDNYFGAVPDITVNNILYTTLFTSFAYKPVSSNVTAYYIGRVGFGMAEMLPVTDAIPPASPVIIQCAGKNVSDNKLKVLESQNALPNNSLSGVYFNFNNGDFSNQTPYNPQTMRILGICSDGSLGFVTSDIEYLPANTAYLTVPAGSAPEFKCVNSGEYDANIPEAPDQIYLNSDYALQPQDDYTYTGTFNFPVSTNGAESFKINFYTDAVQTEENMIGTYSLSDVNFALTSPFSSPFAYGSKGSWVITDWEGGDLSVTINIQYQYVTFSSKRAGIENVAIDNGIKFSDNIVSCKENSFITVYSLDGRILLSTFSDKLDLTALSKGVYIVKVNNESIKILR